MAKKRKNTIEEYENLKKAITDNSLSPVLVMDGPESFFQDQILEKIESDFLPEEVKEFSFFQYYGKDIKHTDVVAACHQSSFLSPQTLVIVKEAQNLKNFDQLLSYMESPNPNCLLVLSFKNKKIDSRTKFYKAINKNGNYFHSNSLYDNEVKRWIKTFAKEIGFEIADPEVEILFTFLGADLTKIAMELDKLSLNLKPGDKITADAIENFIGISKSYNPFALTKSISYKNQAELYRTLAYYEANPKAAPLMVILTVLTNYYVQLIQYHQIKAKNKFEIAKILKINPFFVDDFVRAGSHIDAHQARAALNLLYEYNKKAVGIGEERKSENLITELLIRLFHAA